MTTTAPLPDPVLRMLDGTDLEEKVGETFLLVAVEPSGWPRMAMLSAGEVYAAGPGEVRLALYTSSGTTQALTSEGKALLILVIDEVTYKIRLSATRVTEDEGARNALFTARVVQVDEDKVGYATVEHGIRFSLADEAATVERWRSTVDLLRRMGT